MTLPGPPRYHSINRSISGKAIASAFIAVSLLAASPAVSADDYALCDHSVDNPDLAITACTKLFEPGHGNPPAPLIYLKRGNAWVRKGFYSSAIEDFNAALQRDPNFTDAYKNRGLAWTMSGDFDRAIADFNQAIRLDANSAQLYNGRGSALFNKGEDDRAIVDFDAAIRLDPSYANAFTNRGLALHRKNEFDRAIADFDRVIALTPKAADGYNNRAMVLMDKADYAAAIADYDTAIRLDPKDWRAYSSRGEAWRLKGDLDRALADHNEALKRNPNAVDAYNNRALVWRDKGQIDRAIADYDEAILLNPRYDRAYGNRGEIWRLKSDFARSLADLNKAVSLDPSSPIWLSYRGETFRLMGDLDHALADFNEALRILPTAVIAYTGRGLTLEKKGNEPDARAAYEKALGLSPDIDASLARPAQQIARQRIVIMEEAARSRKEAEAERSRKAAEAAATAAAATAAATALVLKKPVVDFGRRVALIIGNSGYRSVAPLPNAATDGEVLAKALRDDGFQVVTYQRDATREELVNALRKFEDEADHADWAVVYYAGHGIEVGGANYVIPVDARLRSDRDVEDETVSLDRILRSIEGAKKLRLVILDACRENPFIPQMRRTVASRSVGRGLARIEPEGGSLVVYSAKEGQVALDGDGRSSPFLASLLRQLKTPNVEISKMFRVVRDEVLAATGRQQEPFVYGSLPAEDFYFLTK
jgi:tetratricopeptide (TPR) repeat protein